MLLGTALLWIGTNSQMGSQDLGVALFEVPWRADQQFDMHRLTALALPANLP